METADTPSLLAGPGVEISHANGASAQPAAPTPFQAVIDDLREKLRIGFVGSTETFGQAFGELTEVLRGAALNENEEPKLEKIQMRALFYVLWTVQQQASATMTMYGLAKAVRSTRTNNMPAALKPLRSILASKGIEISFEDKTIHVRRT